MSKTYKFNLIEKYFLLIRDNLKTKEGRIYKGKFIEPKIYDFIEFHNKNNPEEIISCQITAINYYKSFYNMLTTEGTEKFLPGVKNLNEAINIYQNISNYREEELIYGVVSFSFSKK